VPSTIVAARISGGYVGGTVALVSHDSLVLFDDEGNEIVLDESEATALGDLSDGLEPATVSACQQCRSRVVACAALVDLLDAAPPHPRGPELIELADEAPTHHLFVQDLLATCRHRLWRDPGYAEWREALDALLDRPRGVH
jgi:hypothetical protein